MADRAVDCAGAGALPGTRLQLLRGRKRILALGDVLPAFACGCDQDGALSDLGYFLGKPGFLKRVPVLVLLHRGGENDGEDAGDCALEAFAAQRVLGAVLLYEYCALGVRTGVYTSNDRSGGSTLVAPPALRDRVAATVVRRLVRKGAHLVLFSYRGSDDRAAGDSRLRLTESRRLLWATRQRVLADYLPLEATYDGTLAAIGQRTRSNMRYYRRRAEKDLGCRFLPEAAVSREELARFNKECMYAVPDRLALWRMETLATLSDPVFAGVKDRDGRWLALLGGRRQGTCTEILWQMNRDNLPHLSISLVMRSYLIEREIERGATRLSIEGGTPHPISQSFRPCVVKDVLTMRRSTRARLILRLAPRVRRISNELITMLRDPELKWASLTSQSTRVPDKRKNGRKHELA